MVELIGLVTMAALIRLLDFGMANESEAERRRLSMSGREGVAPLADAIGAQPERDRSAATRVAA
ncbi:MAG: hypothetical protein FJ245_13440 [Nitrospira sp.]|nr:hypothetical protein [Nitrospira sp.]